MADEEIDKSLVYKLKSSSITFQTGCNVSVLLVLQEYPPVVVNDVEIQSSTTFCMTLRYS